MFHALLAVTPPNSLPDPSAKVRSLVEDIVSCGDGETLDDEQQALEGLLLENLTVFECLLGAFEATGFDDVVAVVVDGTPAYLDTQERIDDLQEALEGTARSGAMAEGFSVLRVTFCRRDEGLKLLAELRCHARRDGQGGEVRVRVSARPLDADPTDEEGPREYAARVRGYVGDTAAIETQRATVQDVCVALSAKIPTALAGVSIEAEDVVVRLIAPGARQLGRMRHLEFASLRKRTVACALPSYERTGPYDDPLSRHYYSPYHDLFHWLAVGVVLEGKLETPHVEVVSTTGRHLFRGDRWKMFDTSEFAVPRDVVRVSPQGRLKIDSSVPEVARLVAEEDTTARKRGWLGDAGERSR